MDEPSTGQAEPPEQGEKLTPVVVDFTKAATDDHEYVDDKDEVFKPEVEERPTEKGSSLDVRKSNLYGDIPFEVMPQLFELDSTGMEIEALTNAHGITIDVPPGAVPEGSPSVKLECAVTLPVSGLFRFPEGVKPVSPVLWLCMDSNEFEFSEPIEITLPHHINCSDAKEFEHLSFYKATHDAAMQQVVFSFDKVTESTHFQGSHGKLYTKHSCFLCICTHNVEKLALRSNYCLINVVPKEFGETISNAKLSFCVTYFMGTCIQVRL